MEEKAKEIIEKVRPYVKMHGGDVSFLSIEGNAVKIKVSGACAHCSLTYMTYNEVLGGLLKKEIPEIEDIIIET